ncbi:uncharacterized protein LOC107466283 [Arachis duranensis]|uniref:Uncharacterized protein LOC107466283 n=1 Tax=Arachis duranensis TaxID=130453 RepID=A0A6P4BJ13_ARADU|nr:uncharacterized protein LOC107466283 [Arachis duranensis]
MAFHKDALMAYTGKLAPIQMSKLEKEKKEGNYWEAQWVGDNDHNVFEVRRHGRTLRVNTQERTCTCRKWQLTGLPCCHGVAAIQRKNQRPEDYAHHWLIMEAYNRTYQFHINTVPSQEYWADTEGLPCLPPSYKRPIERPTKKRARHESERQNGSQYRLKRSYGKTSCKYCEKVGHNSRTCPDKKTHVATEEDANAQQAPQVGQPNGRHVQPAAGENLPHLDLEDMSDSEQERFWEETMDAVEEELTQGHPHSEADEEVVHILINSDYSNLTCGT